MSILKQLSIYSIYIIVSSFSLFLFIGKVDAINLVTTISISVVIDCVVLSLIVLFLNIHKEPILKSE